MGRLSGMNTSLRQASRSLFTSALSWTCLPVALLREYFTCANVPLDLATARVMLLSILRSLRHLRSEVECASLGISTSVAFTFSCSIGGRSRRWSIVSRSQPRNVFQVDQAYLLAPDSFRR